jgi:hypothetical protein
MPPVRVELTIFSLQTIEAIPYDAVLHYPWTQFWNTTNLSIVLPLNFMGKKKRMNDDGLLIHSQFS